LKAGYHNLVRDDARDDQDMISWLWIYCF